MLITLLLFSACHNEKSSYKEELENAEQMAEAQNWVGCITNLQSLLAENINIEINDEIKAWFLMSKALTSIGQHNKASEILNFLVQENRFGNEIEEEAYKRLIQVYTLTKQHEELAQARTSLLELERANKQLNQDEEAEILMQIGIDYQIGQNFKKANEFLEIAIEKTENLFKRTEMMFFKAYNEFHLSNVEQAKAEINNLLQIEGIKKVIKGQALYLLGEILEKENDILNAYNQYKIALDYYPNKKLIQNRLEYLEKKYPHELKS